MKLYKYLILVLILLFIFGCSNKEAVLQDTLSQNVESLNPEPAANSESEEPTDILKAAYDARTECSDLYNSFSDRYTNVYEGDYNSMNMIDKGLNTIPELDKELSLVKECSTKISNLATKAIPNYKEVQKQWLENLGSCYSLTIAEMDLTKPALANYNKYLIYKKNMFIADDTYSKILILFSEYNTLAIKEEKDKVLINLNNTISELNNLKKQIKKANSIIPFSSLIQYTKWIDLMIGSCAFKEKAWKSGSYGIQTENLIKSKEKETEGDKIWYGLFGNIISEETDWFDKNIAELDQKAVDKYDEAEVFCDKEKSLRDSVLK